MNDVMILRRGGGGSSKLFAAIGVEYPAGSTCTCAGKNSGKVLTAKETPWIFSVPEIDEWTIVATDGNKSKSTTINITHEGQVESVKLSYELVLYERGVFGTAADGTAFKAAKNSQSGSASITLRSSDMLWQESGNSWDIFYITPKVCPAGFSTLNIAFSADSDITIDSNSGKWGLASSVSDVDDDAPVFAGYKAFNSFSGAKVISYDVSGFTSASEYYAVMKFGTSYTDFNGYVTKIWLE